MKSHYTETDDGTYRSRSTIDNEPQEQSEPEQVEMFNMETEVEKLSAAPHERKMKVELTLKLTPSGDKTITIPVLVCEYPSSRVPELLKLAIEGRRFKRILWASLDNPNSAYEPSVLEAFDSALDAGATTGAKAIGKLSKVA